jgi:hypothetical protein
MAPHHLAEKHLVEKHFADTFGTYKISLSTNIKVLTKWQGHGCFDQMSVGRMFFGQKLRRPPKMTSAAFVEKKSVFSSKIKTKKEFPMISFTFAPSSML